jgi:hypothetical protein
MEERFVVFFFSFELFCFYSIVDFTDPLDSYSYLLYHLRFLVFLFSDLPFCGKRVGRGGGGLKRKSMFIFFLMFHMCINLSHDG